MLKLEGMFVLGKRSKTGIVYIPADLVKDSQFPLKVGAVEISIDNRSNRIVVEQAGR
jgi:hypothetical protein